MRSVIYVFLAVFALGQANLTSYIDSFCNCEYPKPTVCVCSNLTYSLSDTVRVDVRKKFNFTRLSLEDSTLDVIPEGAPLLAEAVEQFWVVRSHVKLLRKRNFYTGSGNSTLLRLILDDNEIHTIPSKVFELVPNLQHLSMCRNSISDLEIDSFYGLGQLRKLKLDKNELTTIDERVFIPLENVELIRLSENKLVYLPENLFSQNLNLLYVQLRQNKLKIIDERVVTNHRALQFALKNFNTHTKITSTALFKHPSIRLFDVSFNTLPYISSKTFAQTPNLTTFYAIATNLYFVERGAFEHQSSLDSLHLSQNNLDSFDVYLPRTYGAKAMATYVLVEDMTLCEVPPEYEPGWSRIYVRHDPLDCSKKLENEKWSADIENGRNRCKLDVDRFYMLVTAIVILLLYALILTLYCCYYRNKESKERLCFVIDDSDPLVAHRNEERKY